MAKRQQQKLAEATKEVLRTKGWSLLSAENYTGVSRTIVQQMSKGSPPSELTILQWAKAIHEPRSKWLQLGGYDPEVIALLDPEASTVAPGDVQNLSEGAAITETREPEPDADGEWPVDRDFTDEDDLVDRSVSFFGGDPSELSGDERERVKAIMRALMKRHTE